MSGVFKTAGKKFELSQKSSSEVWKFSRRPGGWILAERTLPGGRSERRRLMVSQFRHQLSIALSGWTWLGELQEVSRGSGGAGSAGAELVAQFPGKVRKVLVKDGDLVQEGDPLVLVEAMKMEFAVKAPATGKITRVLVKDGQQLAPGDRFVDFEEKSK